jgi:hypothetical protein
MLWDLLVLQRRLVPQRHHELDLTSSPLMDEPPSKIDQHEPSHSRMHYT